MLVGALDWIYLTLSVIGGVLLLVGFVGCVAPVLPGPPISFLGILLLYGAGGWRAESFGGTTLVVLGAAAALVTVLDFLTPVWGAKKYGASRAGVWGSVAGMIVGALFFPPFGLIIGAFVGAVAGELMAGKEGNEAARAAWGVFIGTMAGIVLKLVVSGVIAFYYVRELFS
jgi:uncharacterized protein YqgC (DUF456 family)